MDIGLSVHKDHEFARRIAQLEHHFEMKKKLDAQIIEHLAAEKRSLYLKLGEHKRQFSSFYNEVQSFVTQKLKESGLGTIPIMDEFEAKFKDKYLNPMIVGSAGDPSNVNLLKNAQKGSETGRNPAALSNTDKTDRSASIPRYARGPAEEPTTAKKESTTTNIRSRYNLREQLNQQDQEREKGADDTPGKREIKERTFKAYDMRDEINRKSTKTPDRARGDILLDTKKEEKSDILSRGNSEIIQKSNQDSKDNSKIKDSESQDFVGEYKRQASNNEDKNSVGEKDLDFIRNWRKRKNQEELEKGSVDSRSKKDVDE